MDETSDNWFAELQSAGVPLVVVDRELPRFDADFVTMEAVTGT